MLYYVASSIPQSVVLPCSSFRKLGVLTQNIPGMIKFEIEERGNHAMFFFGMHCTRNLPALEKYDYINGTSPCIAQESASEDCGRSGRGEGGLSCKVRGLKTMLSSCQGFCFITCYVVPSHIIFASTRRVQHLTVV
jgi:hypothetical protein